jgi:hypothetical protein
VVKRDSKGGSKSTRSKSHVRGIPILKTEKDGRLYAIALLEKLNEEVVANPGFSPLDAHAEQEDDSDPAGVMMIFRKAPQSVTLAQWSTDLHRYGTAQAIAGFYVVMTHYMGSVMEGSIPDESYYVEKEKAGEWEPSGSVIYRDPKAAAEAISKGENTYRVWKGNSNG